MYTLSGFLVFLSCILTSGYSIAVEIPCDNDYHCLFFTHNLKCISGRCKCPDNLLLSSDGSKCLEKAVEYGSPCEDNLQCSHRLSAGGVCEENTCTCKSGYHYLKGKCWKSSNLHENCAKREQCISAYEYIGLDCVEGKCKCRSKYYERGSFGCRRERIRGESCNLDRDCVDGSTCEAMECQNESPDANRMNVTVRTFTSPRGKVPVDEEFGLELGMNCKKDSDCDHIANAYCLDGSVCACEPAKYIASDNNRECLRVVRGKIDDITRTACKKDAQCGVFGGNSICQNRRCACNNGSYWERNNALCWPLKKLGESCTTIIDCNPSASHADCINKVCSCKPGYHPRGPVCVPDATKVGDSCETDEECLIPNTFCNSTQMCECIEHSYPENGKCVPGVETNCETNNDCAHLKNTECKIGNQTEKQCLCLERHTSSEDYKYCLPVKSYKESCSETFQCTPKLGNFGECINNTCQCRNKAHYSHGMCHRSKYVGQRCSKLPECFAGNDTNSIMCLKGYCSCNYDYEPNKDGTCVRTNSGAALKFYSALMSIVILIALRR